MDFSVKSEAVVDGIVVFSALAIFSKALRPHLPRADLVKKVIS